jgi:hypothetical protein
LDAAVAAAALFPAWLLLFVVVVVVGKNRHRGTASSTAATEADVFWERNESTDERQSAQRSKVPCPPSLGQHHPHHPNLPLARRNALIGVVHRRFHGSDVMSWIQCDIHSH